MNLSSTDIRNNFTKVGISSFRRNNVVKIDSINLKKNTRKNILVFTAINLIYVYFLIFKINTF